MQAKDHPAAEVYVRQRWSDDWQHVPYLYADDVVFTTGGQIATARLSWRYGVGWQPDDGEFRTYTRQELADWFVAVVIPQSTEGAPSVIWYGVVVDEVDLRDGHVCNDYYPTLQTNTEPSGQQTLVCYGLELLLERTLVVDSDVLSTVAGGEPVEVTVDEGLTFNQMIFEPASASFRFDNYARNRSPEPAADQARRGAVGEHVPKGPSAPAAQSHARPGGGGEGHRRRGEGRRTCEEAFAPHRPLPGHPRPHGHHDVLTPSRARFFSKCNRAT